jgi:hypothetical protein
MPLLWVSRNELGHKFQIRLRVSTERRRQGMSEEKALGPVKKRFSDAFAARQQRG